MLIIEQFAKKHNKSWANIINALEATNGNFQRISKEFENLPPIASADTDLVLFGSIARNECTLKSDVDWTLLVDGQANSDHLNIAHLIEDGLAQTGLAEPGKSGMFGQITFSHDLIHYIGGQDDTNHNLSRRILLLLESEVALKDTVEGSALDRVIRGVISKYVDNDSGYAASSRKENVPRFLLNDIIRFWRTMCVDFAYKQIEQHGQKWALRNIKLRMSRRLIFVKGLLMCARLYKTESTKEDIKEELRRFAAIKPLEFMVSTFEHFNVKPDIVIQLLDCYDKFLGMLNDEDFRSDMASLDMYKAYGNDKFEAARANSHDFLNALNQVFLTPGNTIFDFTIKYGVF